MAGIIAHLFGILSNLNIRAGFVLIYIPTDLNAWPILVDAMHTPIIFNAVLNNVVWASTLGIHLRVAFKGQMA